MRVLYATSECAPWVKTGGLGDVAGAFTAQLKREGVDVRVLMPAYRPLRDIVEHGRSIARLPAFGALPESRLVQALLPSGVPALLVDAPTLFDRDGGPYQDASGNDFADNAQRFALLARTAALLSTDASPLDWRPNILHCNDWQTAPAPAVVAHASGARATTLLTIHNLAFQGVFDGDLTPLLGLPSHAFGIDGVEFYGRTSFLKAGLVFADWLSTVSPTYAWEIQQSALGMGLEGLLAKRRHELTGILNGIDESEWNPARDPALAANYDANTLDAKAPNKRALQHEMGLDTVTDLPLLGVVSRLTQQKGSDLIASVAKQITSLPAQLVVLGTGERAIEHELTEAARARPRAIAARIGFDEPLAHRIEAGADAFLMPSRFEPCGLNQMYSLRYGTPPVARATGGLADSIVDATLQTLHDGTATGFLFDAATAAALVATIERAVQAMRNQDLWRAMQRAGMAQAFGWARRSQDYLKLYRSLLGERCD